jgi:hypothetical protein
MQLRHSTGSHKPSGYTEEHVNRGFDTLRGYRLSIVLLAIARYAVTDAWPLTMKQLFSNIHSWNWRSISIHGCKCRGFGFWRLLKLKLKLNCECVWINMAAGSPVLTVEIIHCIM